MSVLVSDQQPVQVSTYGMTDTGQRRADNQDNMLIADLSVPAEDGGYALSADVTTETRPGRFAVGSKGVLLLVADGMGGAAAGAVASAMAVAEMHARMVADWSREAESTHHQFALRLRQSVEAANASIFARAQAEPECRGMGTTATAAGVLGEYVYVAQVGDSRAYLVRDGNAVQLTRDQSYVQELIDAGRMTEEEAERSEHANKILQALGAAPTVSAVITHQQLRRGDVIVLCSDGLSRVVQRDEIAAAASGMTDPSALCATLIDLANERGGPDNITVVAAAFDGPGLAESAAEDVVTRSVYEPPSFA